MNNLSILHLKQQHTSIVNIISSHLEDIMSITIRLHFDTIIRSFLNKNTY